jgi:hypothetical protein
MIKFGFFLNFKLLFLDKTEHSEYYKAIIIRIVFVQQSENLEQYKYFKNYLFKEKYLKVVNCI